MTDMKKIIAIIIAAVMILSLCGCMAVGKAPVQDTETVAADSEEISVSGADAVSSEPEKAEPESKAEEEPADSNVSSEEEKQQSASQISEKPKETESEQSKRESRTESKPATEQAESEKPSQKESDPHAWGENDEVGEINEDPYESYSGPKITVTVAINSSNMGSSVAGNTSVAIPEGSSAYVAIKTALDKMGMDYVMSASYLKSIDGLSDMDGGPMSGWLYYVNGKKPNYAINGYTMKDGDTLLLYYTVTGMD